MLLGLGATGQGSMDAGMSNVSVGIASHFSKAISSSLLWRGVSCTCAVPRHWTSIASTSKRFAFNYLDRSFFRPVLRMQPLHAAFSRCLCQSRRWRTLLRSFVASRRSTRCTTEYAVFFPRHALKGWQVRITDAAVVNAVTMSERYIADRFLPDKVGCWCVFT
jgi:hypothetical protein